MKKAGANMNVSAALRTAILAAVKHTDSAVMLFGSKARGDDSASSDIDILELTERRGPPYRQARMNISVYDEKTLRVMSEQGSLFALHLFREGVIVRDPKGKLTSCLKAYKPPPSYEPYRGTLREIADLLDATEVEYTAHWKPYNELALFLLRSALYAQFAEAGEPIFSLRTIRNKISRQDLTDVFRLKSFNGPDFILFTEACKLVAEFLKTKIYNKWNSIEALITNIGLTNPLILAFGLRLLGRKDSNISYDILTFPDFGG